jgi:nucleotide-binding universal stress UspA family protein
MAFKSILTIWDGRRESRATLDIAINMTRKADGHLNILCLGIDPIQSGLYYAGTTPLLVSESISNARESAKKLEDEVSEIMRLSDVNWSCQVAVAQLGGIAQVVGRIARFNDLVILPKPYGDGAPEESAAALEAALFEGDVPVLVCPCEPAIVAANRIIIAWNESTEALAAIRAALPTIANAKAVDIAIIDPARHDAERTDPGAELSKMLARHGAKVSVSVLARTVPQIAEVLERHAVDFGADLIVMGAYGHSRFRESILGGATRDMLEAVKLPVFMAH